MILLYLVLCIQISIASSAPVQIPMLQPLLQQRAQHPTFLQLPLQQSALLQQLMPSEQRERQTTLLQQLLALQQLQALQRMQLQAPITTHLQRPLLILLPKIKTEKHQLKSNLNLEDPKSKHGIIDEDSDSVIIDSESNDVDKEAQKGILLIPNDGRFFIGDIISNIPFLPIEVNVPDAISWIYNGIAGIISGIGQRLPFRPYIQNMEQVDMGNPQMKMMMPVLLMPLDNAVQN